VKVGFNYPVGYNRFGDQIGPDFNCTPQVWAANNALAAAGQVSKIPLSPVFDHVSRNLANLEAMGISVVRWFLLGNGTNYGPPPTRPTAPVPAVYGYGSQLTWTFSPPGTLDDRFARDFEELLQRFAQTKMQLLPVLISFEFGAALKGGPAPNGTFAGGRADALTDPAKRKVFLDTMLGGLLAVSAKYKDQIYAWEVINEPYWLCFAYGPLSSTVWSKREAEVTDQQMADFLTDALQRIAAAGFASTVGHRFFDDLQSFPAGTVPQFHYYAEHSFWATAGSYAGLNTTSDPAQISGSGLFSADPKPIVGEFGSSANRFGDPWAKDLSTNDTTLTRLRLLQSQGCDLALIWGDLGGAQPGKASADALTAERGQIDQSDIIKLLPATRADIATFTGGVVPPAGE
jgi:hypothetical protein